MKMSRLLDMKNMTKDKFIQMLSTLAGWIGVSTSGLALAAYAYLGTFSRLYADDFCMSGLVVRHGFWSAQWIQYSTWSNRYAGMLTLTVSDLLGPSFVRLWTVLTLLLWVLGLTYALIQVGRLLRVSLPKWMPFLFAEWVTFFTILLAPEVYQTIFWRIGIITYTLPLAFMMFLIGLMIHGHSRVVNGKKSIGWMVGTGLLAFFAGGFSETYLALQTSILLAILVLVLLARPKSAWQRTVGQLVAAALAGSLLSLLIVFMAPGNAVRQAAMPAPPGLLSLAKMSIVGAFLFIYASMKYNAFQWLLALLGSMLLVYSHSISVKDGVRWRPSLLISGLFVAPVVGYLAVTVIMTPAAYAQSSYPDGRVLINASFVLALVLIVEGCLLGTLLGQLHLWAEETPPLYLRCLAALLLLVVFLYPLYDAYKSYRLVPEYRADAVAWDERDAMIRAVVLNGERHVEAWQLDAPGRLADLQADSRKWPNSCIAIFYALDSIIAVPPSGE